MSIDDGRSVPLAPGRTVATSVAKRLGALGFIFFLVKGLLWLALPGLLVMLGMR